MQSDAIENIVESLAQREEKIMAEQNGMQIYKLIPAIMRDIGAIGKNQVNKLQSYAFRGIDDVMSAFHNALVKHEVFFAPQVLESSQTERQTQRGGTLIYTRLRVAYTFFAPDGSNVCAIVEGEAMDSSDKSTNKAMSAELKYALLQVFCVPTSDMEDADSDSPQPIPRTIIQEQQSGGIVPEQIKAIKNLCAVKGIAIENIGAKFNGEATIDGFTFEQASEAIRYLQGA